MTEMMGRMTKELITSLSKSESFNEQNNEL